MSTPAVCGIRRAASSVTWSSFIIFSLKTTIRAFTAPEHRISFPRSLGNPILRELHPLPDRRRKAADPARHALHLRVLRRARIDKAQRQERETLFQRGPMELNMDDGVTQETLPRTAKYFMDNGRADSHEQAMNVLREFGLDIEVGTEVATSRDHQIALLTLVN